MIPYMEDAKNKSKNKWHSDAEYEVSTEAVRAKHLGVVRFVRSMKQVIEKMKISDNADEFDDLLLKIS